MVSVNTSYSFSSFEICCSSWLMYLSVKTWKRAKMEKTYFVNKLEYIHSPNFRHVTALQCLSHNCPASPSPVPSASSIWWGPSPWIAWSELCSASKHWQIWVFKRGSYYIIFVGTCNPASAIFPSGNSLFASSASSRAARSMRALTWPKVPGAISTASFACRALFMG